MPYTVKQIEAHVEILAGKIATLDLRIGELMSQRATLEEQQADKIRLLHAMRAAGAK